MTLHVPISREIEAKLREKAAGAGVDVQTFAARALERVATRPSLGEALAPLRAQVDASGISEAELTDLLESAKHDLRARHRADPRP